MNATRFIPGCALVFSFSGVLACSGVQPRVQISPIKIPAGMRAVTVKVNEISGIVPGKRVDVLVTTSGGTTIVLNDVSVVASEQVKPSVGVVTLITARRGKRNACQPKRAVSVDSAQVIYVSRCWRKRVSVETRLHKLALFLPKRDISSASMRRS